MEVYHVLPDRRVNCLSVMTSMTLGDYLKLIERVYKERGGIEGQRGPLKTKTGITIRNRMVADVQAGAVLPPLVIGVLVRAEEMLRVKSFKSFADFFGAVSDFPSDSLSVIDGMQRTTAIKDAVAANPKAADLPIRVEFWISEFLHSLIYRMLVLNSGQVPWELGRQLETVYGQFLQKISTELQSEMEIFEMEDNRRRSTGGQYQSRNIIELLLIFSSRKSEVEIKDRVAEDFARLDAIETSSHAEFLEYFINTLRLMANLDRALSTYPGIEPTSNTRFKQGKDVFKSFPAMAGFCSAVSVTLFDEPGFTIRWEDVPERMGSIQGAIEGVTERILAMDVSGLHEFLQIELLEERLSQRSGQVGRFEREFFRKAFNAMIRNADRLENLTPCWMA